MVAKRDSKLYVIGDFYCSARRGRIYLPQDELAQAGLSEEDVFNGKVTDKWRNFMENQIARARMFFREAEEGVCELSQASRWPVRPRTRFLTFFNGLKLQFLDIRDWTALNDLLDVYSNMCRTSDCNCKLIATLLFMTSCRCMLHCYYISKYWMRLKQMTTTTSQKGRMWAKPRS